MNPLFIKNYTAGAATAAYRIAKLGSADTAAVQAAADGDALIGVFCELAADSGERVDVTLIGLATVEYGGAITRGDPLTADADGKAIKAVFDGSGKVNIVGIAMRSGVAGDLGLVFVAPSRLGPDKLFVPFSINQTDLLAGTPHFVASPGAGNVTGLTVVVQTAVTTGGAITAEIGGTAIDGLSVTVADAAAAGTVYSGAPSSATHATTVIAQNGAVEIVPAAAFATAGAVNGFVEITLA